MADSCVFCKIASGQIPSYKVYEDALVIAYLDIHPASRGHTLVVTKEHFSNMTTCPKDILDHVFEVAQKIAQAQIAQLGAAGVNVLTNVGEAAGQSIKHFHVHVIPRYSDDGLKLNFPPKQLPDSEMDEVVTSIKKSI